MHLPEVLDQKEIDSLLQALAKGEVSAEEVKSEEEGKKIKTYDFSRPSKFSKEQLRTLEMIHENFARNASNYLSGRMRAFVDITNSSIDQITYNEFIRSITPPSFLGVFTAQELSGTAIIELNLKIVFAMIDRLLGGSGGIYQKFRSLTDIEISLMKNELVRILSSLKEAWMSIYEFSPELVAIENNPQFVQIAPPNEMVVMVTLDVKLGDVEGFVNLCWPSSLLESFSSELYAESYFKEGKRLGNDVTKELLKENIEDSEVLLSALVGKAGLTLKELLGLDAGDVVMLDKHIDEPINLNVNERLKLKCVPGTHKGFNSVQIVGPAEVTENES